METNSERRRRKLAELCAERGITAVAESAGLNWQSLDQVIKGSLMPPKKDGTRKAKNLGNEAAQKIEVAQGLGVGWFDSATSTTAVLAVDECHQTTGGQPGTVVPQLQTGIVAMTATPAQNASNQPPSLIQQAPIAINNITMALKVIADTMPMLSAGQRRLLGPMLAELAVTPESHADVSEALLGWLGAANASSATVPPAKSYSSGGR